MTMQKHRTKKQDEYIKVDKKQHENQYYNKVYQCGTTRTEDKNKDKSQLHT